MERLRDAGAIVERVTLPWRLSDINRAARIHFGMIFGASIGEVYDPSSDAFTSYVRALVADSASITKDDLVAGLALEGAIYQPLGNVLEAYDALVCPTFAVPALPAEWAPGEPVTAEGRNPEDWLDVMMTLPFNIASRCPVMSVPSGRSRDGVPTGLSIVGKTFDDTTVFRIASEHEKRMTGWESPAGRPSL